VVQVTLQLPVSPIPAEGIVRQSLRENAEAVKHGPDADDDQAGREQPSRRALGVDLGVADRADGNDHHVKRVQQRPAVDHHVAGDADGDDDREQDGGKAKASERMLQSHQTKS